MPKFAPFTANGRKGKNMREILLDGGIAEVHIPIIFESRESAETEFARAAKTLESLGAQAVCAEIFGPAWAGEAANALFSGIPVNRIRPLDESAAPTLAGAHITALRGARAEFRDCGGFMSAVYEAGGVRYFRAFGITPGSAEGDGYAETIGNLSAMKYALEKCGYKFTDIARTWFYNFRLLDWYADFNRARTEFFRNEKIFDSLLPASTGIGAPNPAGAKIESGIFALKSSEKGGGKWGAREVESPLQCGAPRYGSSFSRAVEIDTEFSRRVIISGTASIEPEGATAHIGDIKGQVELTMRVIGGILESRGMGFSDTVRAVVYCQRPEFYGEFKKWCAESGAEIPHCPSFSTVCRGDLLFEVELDAARNAR